MFALAILLPLVSAWNLVAPQNRFLKVGPKLYGVTGELPLTVSWAAFRDGSLQKAIAERVTKAFLFRPMLIGINNQIRYGLFGELDAPEVVRGAKGQLFGKYYIEEYCTRTLGTGERLAADMLPKLRDIQDYYRARGGIFVYMTSPSKAAQVPEYFTGQMPCPSTAAARAQLLPSYVDALKAGGIDVIDAASLVHAAKDKYPFGLFPEGGEHWNDVGGALAATVLVDEINKQAGREIVPPFTFSYTLSSPASGADRELADLLNVFFPPLNYLTPKVDYKQPVSCADSPARNLGIAIVGDSFSHLPGSILIEQNCLAGLHVYYYGKAALYGGVPYRVQKLDLDDADLAPLRDVKVLVLEENERVIGRSAFVNMLRDVLKR
jgi:alginate O-acetyltransferase complex protein AlgJ